MQSQRRGKEGEKKVFEEISGQNVSKFSINDKPTDSRRSTEPKQKKNEENHTKGHHNQILRDYLKAARETNTLHTEKQR